MVGLLFEGGPDLDGRFGLCQRGDGAAGLGVACQSRRYRLLFPCHVATEQKTSAGVGRGAIVSNFDSVEE